jgi:hypothetical protein
MRKIRKASVFLVSNQTPACKTSQQKISPIAASPQAEKALRLFGANLHSCGSRPVEEFILDIARGRDFKETIEDFSRLTPSRYAQIVALLVDGGNA